MAFANPETIPGNYRIKGKDGALYWAKNPWAMAVSVDGTEYPNKRYRIHWFANNLEREPRWVSDQEFTLAETRNGTASTHVRNQCGGETRWIQY